VPVPVVLRCYGLVVRYKVIRKSHGDCVTLGLNWTRVMIMVEASEEFPGSDADLFNYHHILLSAP
jgi:hypothetical protein